METTINKEKTIEAMIATISCKKMMYARLNDGRIFPINMMSLPDDINLCDGMRVVGEMNKEPVRFGIGDEDVFSIKKVVGIQNELNEPVKVIDAEDYIVKLNSHGAVLYDKNQPVPDQPGIPYEPVGSITRGDLQNLFKAAISKWGDI